MHKAISYVARGLKGILTAQTSTPTQKLKLYVDYARLMALVIVSPACRSLSNPTLDKTFHLTSFGFTIHYPNILSLFFLLNELFCMREYPEQHNVRTYVDLGANIGIAVLYYHFFNPEARIYAVEPDDRNCEYLRKNIAENHVDNCTIYPLAASDKDGRATFYRILDPIQNLDSGLHLNQRLPFEEFLVETRRISTVLQEELQISLIKIDIEGSEYAVFRDLFATNAIMKADRIVFESHVFNGDDQSEYQSVISRLGQLGEVASHATSEFTALNYFTRAK